MRTTEKGRSQMKPIETSMTLIYQRRINSGIHDFLILFLFFPRRFVHGWQSRWTWMRTIPPLIEKLLYLCPNRACFWYSKCLRCHSSFQNCRNHRHNNACGILNCFLRHNWVYASLRQTFSDPYIYKNNQAFFTFEAKGYSKLEGFEKSENSSVCAGIQVYIFRLQFCGVKWQLFLNIFYFSATKTMEAF